MDDPDSINRFDVNDEWKHAGIITAGDFCFIGYCVGDSSLPLEAQIHGAIDHLERRLALVNLQLESVIKLDLLFRNIWDIPVMETIFEERFSGRYPARKSLQTAFADDGLLFQLDAVAYRGE